ncbi:MAG: zinc-binding dehydrogenase [Betaproteobacteria bacterium]|nr:zinc-binding dehydrogenase [Betaproteobacteria bacterium]HJW79706.1 zinc-binding dehydrogenase [Beijerinckiaceae bacterium]
MKAAVITEHGGPGSIQYRTDYPDPRPGADEILLRVRACTLNYHDIFTRRGMPGITVPMPAIMGLDFAGEVVALGASVKDWKLGERVMIDPVDRVGPGGLVGEVRPGGLAEYCAVPAHHLVRMPERVSYEDAACLPVAYGTAIRMMYTIGDIQAKDRILVLGASGGVGTASVLLSKMKGAEVIACASSSAKLERLKKIGADHVIDYTKEDFVKWVYGKYTKPHRRKFEGGVDVVVNFTGGDTWVPSLKVVHRRGKVLTCGATAGFDPKEDLRYIWSFEIQVLGSNSFMREDLEALLGLIQEGKLKPIVDKELPLSEVNEAFRLIEEREVFGKVVLKP